MIYSDSLIKISDNSIIFFHYYFPFVSKKVSMFDIEKITVEKASILNGKWRIWGTGSLFVWFPLDIKRPWREKIFFVHLKNKRMTIGLTVEHVNRVIEILRNVIPVEIIEHVDNNRK